MISTSPPSILNHDFKPPKTSSDQQKLFKFGNEGSYKVVEGNGKIQIPGIKQKLYDRQTKMKKDILSDIKNKEVCLRS